MSEKKQLQKKIITFPTILHNKQLKFGLLVPVGLLMHEQSTKKIIPSHKFHHRKSAAQKMKIPIFYQNIQNKINGPTGI